MHRRVHGLIRSRKIGQLSAVTVVPGGDNPHALRGGRSKRAHLQLSAVIAGKKRSGEADAWMSMLAKQKAAPRSGVRTMPLSQQKAWLRGQDLNLLSSGYEPDDCRNGYSTRWPARQPISQKSASSRLASLKIAISSASRAG